MARQSTKPALETIQAELADPDYKIRKEAISQLLRYYRQQALEPLLKMLEDGRGDVRSKAVEALGKLKDERAFMPVLGLLQDKHVSARAKAVRALGNFGNRSAVRPLLDLLNDPKPQIRAYAARSLGQLRDPDSLSALLAYFERSKSASENMELYHAARAMGDFDIPGVLEPLLALYQPSANENPLLTSNYWLVSGILSKCGEQTRPILLEILHDQARPAEIRACVARALAQKPHPEYLQPLIAALADEYALVRVNAAEALTKLRDPRAIEPLARLLDDPRENVLSAAAKALGTLHVTTVVDRLVELFTALWFSPQPGRQFVLQDIIQALGHLRDTRAVKPLLNAFLQPLYPTRLDEIATVLCKLNDPLIIEPLLRDLRTFSERQQWYTFRLLEHFRDPRAVEPLLTLLDPQATTRHEIRHQERIIKLLATLGDTSSIEPLRIYAHRATDGLRFTAMSALDTLGAAVRQ